jgi:hypothetical protein
MAKQSLRAERFAVVVNGLLVLLLPLALVTAAGTIELDGSDASVIAEVPGAPRIFRLVPILGRLSAVLLPFALLAAWRTSVYARRWRDRRDRGWGGVAEAAACGLLVALVYLAPGLVTRPADAPPYLIAYGGAAVFLGLLVGLLLRSTALFVLNRTFGSTSPP